MHIMFIPSFNQLTDRNWPFSEFAISVVRFLGPLHLETHTGDSLLFSLQSEGT